jgi:REP element-mobilizing transposase RayT
MGIYMDDRDREHFLELIAWVVASHDVDCHAHCLMSNHYHAVVTTNQPNLSHAMQQLNGRYAEWWDSRHSRPGHVFQGRFGAQVIQADQYLLNASRYIVLNPVRAGMVASPAEYQWSSYRATAGLEPVPAFLNVTMLWRLLGSDDPMVAAPRYREFVERGDASPALPCDLVLGDEGFVQRFRDQRNLASREVPTRDRRGGPPLPHFFANAFTEAKRAEAAAAAHVAGYQMNEIAVFLGVHPTTVGRLLRRVGARGHIHAKGDDFRCDPMTHDACKK